MAKAKKRVAAYTFDNLRAAVSLQPDVVSLQAIARAFGIKEEGLDNLRAKLQRLINEGSITSPKYDRYSSNKPLSSLVVAHVRQSLARPGMPIYLTNDAKLELSIEGLPDDFPFPVTVMGKILKRKFGKSTILPSERMAVVLSRRHGTELIATQVIDKFKFKKMPTIVGHFAKNARVPTFVPYTPGLNKTFNAHGIIPKDINPRISFFARIPVDLDPYAPSLEISEQKWDPDTGIPIASIIANKHGIRPGHDKPAIREAKQVSRQHTPFKGRRDLTEEPIKVVDPDNAKDHDDGVEMSRTRDGYRTLAVIADVPHLVRPGSDLDKTAREKAFTHYLPDDTFHMLPHRLVHHASLHEGHSKPVIYVEQHYDDNFKKIGLPEIGAGVIAAQKKMTYRELEQQLVVERSSNFASYIELGEALVEGMHSEKISFENDLNNRRATFSEMLVAAMMIDANAAIAEHLLAHNVPFPSRSHTGVDNVYAFAEIKMKLEDWGYDVPDHISGMDYEGLRSIIAQAEARKDRPRVEAAIRADFLNLATYSMIPFSHFGLNLRNYGHFSSPIRRYGDIIGLRGVHTSLGNDELGLSEDDIEQMEKTITHLNVRQDVSRRVTLDTQKYYAIRDLQRMEGCHVKAMLGKIDPFNVEIILDHKYGLRKQLDVSTLPEGWTVGNNGKSLIFNNNVRFAVGHHVRIKIGNVRPHLGDWDIYSMEPTFTRPKPRPAITQLAYA